MSSLGGGVTKGDGGGQAQIPFATAADDDGYSSRLVQYIDKISFLWYIQCEHFTSLRAEVWIMFHFSNPFARNKKKITLSIILWQHCYDEILRLLQIKVFTEDEMYILRLATILVLIAKAIDIKSISDPSRDLLENRTIILLDTMTSIIDDVLPRSGDEEGLEEEELLEIE